MVIETNLNGDCKVMGRSHCYCVIDTGIKMDKKEKLHEEININEAVIRGVENRVRETHCFCNFARACKNTNCGSAC